jgi:hypothetical protein
MMELSLLPRAMCAVPDDQPANMRATDISSHKIQCERECVARYWNKNTDRPVIDFSGGLWLLTSFPTLPAIAIFRQLPAA